MVPTVRNSGVVGRAKCGRAFPLHSNATSAANRCANKRGRISYPMPAQYRAYARTWIPFDLPAFNAQVAPYWLMGFKLVIRSQR